MTPRKKTTDEKPKITKPAHPKAVSPIPSNKTKSAASSSAKPKAASAKSQTQKKSAVERPRMYVRFSLAQRIEHVIMLLSFSTLALTGLPQKFPQAEVSLLIIRSLRNVETLRLVHHVAATVMMFGAAYHILVVGYKMYVERTPLSMLPAIQALLYNLGIKKSRPQMSRYTFEEKAEYWAFVWGAVIMGLTGFMMWNPITTSRLMPAEFIPAAKAAHGAEAILAVLAIILWHFYHVHLKIFNKSMWTGKLTEEEMLHDHPLELADIKSGFVPVKIEPSIKRKRQLIYFPIAGVLAAAMLFGIYGFIQGEETSITTIPPRVEQEPIFVPQTPTPLPTIPPTNTPSPAAAVVTWKTAIEPLFQQKCTMCHGQAAIAGLNLSSFADLMKGGQTGPVMVPGDSANSLLVQIQQTGNHRGQLTPEELALLIEWINAGAPEQ